MFCWKKRYRYCPPSEERVSLLPYLEFFTLDEEQILRSCGVSVGYLLHDHRPFAIVNNANWNEPFARRSWKTQEKRYYIVTPEGGVFHYLFDVNHHVGQVKVDWHVNNRFPHDSMPEPTAFRIQFGF